jgi:hypothetical protein
MHVPTIFILIAGVLFVIILGAWLFKKDSEG